MLIVIHYIYRYMPKNCLSYLYPFFCIVVGIYINEYDIAQHDILFRLHSLGLWTERGRRGKKKYGCHGDI